NHNNNQLGGHFLAVHFQLAAKDLIVLNRIAAVGGQWLDEMDEHTSPLYVAQELMAQTDADVRAFDEPGKIGQDEAVLAAYIDHAEGGILGRERIISGFGTS